MKPSRLKTWPAALGLGAAAFASPAQAFQCRPDFVPQGASIETVFDSLVAQARERLARTGSIFIGRLTSVTYLRTNFPQVQYLMSFDVLEWKKGSGHSPARFIYSEWCNSGECSQRAARDAGAALQSNYSGQRLYFVGDGRPFDLRSAVASPGNLDGSIDQCALIGSMVPLDTAKPRTFRTRQERLELLYQIALEEEIDRLPKPVP